MDGLNAAILSAKLQHLDSWIIARRDIAKQYEDLEQSGIILPHEPENNKHVFHLYVVESRQRDQLHKALVDKNISVGRHYPDSLPTLGIFDSQDGAYPVSERIAGNGISLPLFPELTLSEVNLVKEIVRGTVHDC